MTLNNRLNFFVGVNTGLVTAGLPDDRYVQFYRTRSSTSLHCAIVGNVVVPGGYGSNRTTPSITEEPIWAAVAQGIQLGGSIPGIQLATAWAGYAGSRSFVAADGAQVIEQARSLIGSLGTLAIDATMNSFVDAASMAIAHGFRHVQIHAAHGYLLSLLVDARINPEATRVHDRLAALSQSLRSQHVETSIRISLMTGDKNFDAAGAVAFQDTIAALPFDFVDLSSGYYNIDKRLIYPSLPDILTARREQSVALASRHPNTQFILSGRIMGQGKNLPANAHLGICRDLIANPRFLSEPGNGCRNHGKCHYHSRGGDHITCKRWE